MAPLKTRTGARRIKEIPDDVLSLLNKGELATVNLVEWLAVDLKVLLKSVLPQIGLERRGGCVLDAYAKYEKEGFTKRIKAVGKILHDEFDGKGDYDEAFEILATHKSDIIREFAAYMQLANNNIEFSKRMQLTRRFAADEHMGVRECAWDSLRHPYLSDNLDEALVALESWVLSDCEYTRRFAIEATRPCGVWTAHIGDLKERPERAIRILNVVKADKSRYVQNAVGNWLNDASKYQAQWVINLCDDWLEESGAKETKYIANRSLRTIRKKK